MNVIWTANGQYQQVGYSSEADLEGAILTVQTDLFGANRIYLDVKKKIGTKGGLQNVPDGYLIDLTGKQPRLYVVENELNAHDPLRHIAVQILQFSLSFEASPQLVKKVLLGTLQAQTSALQQCEAYVNAHGFRNIDHFLEYLVIDSPFAALVIIDEMPANLETILVRRFQFGVEVIELARYENKAGERAYLFEPFLADLVEDIVSPTVGVKAIDAGAIDCIVVPAHDDGFQEVFLNEDRWYSIRVHGSMIPQIKYIAVYRSAPISAITHIAPVKSIEPWKDTSKFVVTFSEPAEEIGPIPNVKGGRVKPPQAPRYAMRARLLSAKTLDEVW